MELEAAAGLIGKTANLDDLHSPVGKIQALTAEVNKVPQSLSDSGDIPPTLAAALTAAEKDAKVFADYGRSTSSPDDRTIQIRALGAIMSHRIDVVRERLGQDAIVDQIIGPTVSRYES